MPCFLSLIELISNLLSPRTHCVASVRFVSPQDMWFGRESPIAPRDLKWAIGRVREEFHGYNQQDSQELMAFLLDGLHEDLNRIKKKPYYEVAHSLNPSSRAE